MPRVCEEENRRVLPPASPECPHAQELLKPLDATTLQNMLTRILAVKEVQQEQEAVQHQSPKAKNPSCNDRKLTVPLIFHYFMNSFYVALFICQQFSHVETCMAIGISPFYDFTFL